jgi:hypothetical protein
VQRRVGACALVRLEGNMRTLIEIVVLAVACGMVGLCRWLGRDVRG